MMHAVQTPAFGGIDQVNSLRACQLCTHHTVDAGELRCLNRRVTGFLHIVACETARYTAGGGCGPNATHLDLQAPVKAQVQRIPLTPWMVA